MCLFFIGVIAVGFVFSQIYRSPGILYFAVIFSLLMNFFSYWYSDKIILKMSGAKLADHDNHRELFHLVENLCITAGLPMPKIYIINDPAPNAFATGRNKEHAVVAVTTGLLERLNKAELEGVVAHELSHIGNRDILISTIVVVLVGFIALLSDFFLRFSFFGGRRDDRSDGRLQAILMIVGIALAILAPIAAILIQLAVSRKREFLADASASLLTRYPEGLALALEKISQYKQPMKMANKATAHLYISNPFGAKRISRLFMTHPLVEERVKALRGMEI
ncbi:MAG: M48 family metallopeptidase [Candidatus Terrybacteria bacterium]|nr:M48 family metallopeptidase [Candidatus Terrybacteria bacterium]